MKTNYEYNHIIPQLKRVTLEDKLNFSAANSLMLIDPAVRNDPEQLREHLLPWELECYVMLSLKAVEWKQERLSKAKFISIMNNIRNAYHPKLFEHRKNEQFIRWFMTSAAALQFDYQECFWYKLYRHTYYFNYVSTKVNMKEEFEQKFGTAYSRMAHFAFAIWIVCLSELKGTKHYIDKVCNLYPKELACLSISRDDYIKALDNITKDPLDYIYCLRPSYSFPFVLHSGQVYLPLPHLVMRAATTSLMFRLTDGNSKLREDIGLEVFESYLLKIIKDSKEFDEVIEEQVYSKGKLKNQRTPDIMTRIGNEIVCFDSKSFTPKSSLRVFSETAYNDEIKRLGKAIKQMYEQLHDKFGNEYHYLDTAVKDDKCNIWGVVIVSENPYIRMEEIYEEAARQLKKQLSPEEFVWLQAHVGIASISAIEEQLFCCSNILSIIQRNAQTKEYNDYWFTGREIGEECPEIKAFKETISDSALKELLPLVDTQSAIKVIQTSNKVVPKL